jgi:hypothetical protein
MKRLLLLLCLALTPVTLACHPPSTIVTEPGRIAFSADNILVRVKEVEQAAVQANQTGALDNAQTRVIVEYAVAAKNVLTATPTGWQMTVKALWREALTHLTTTNPTVQLAVTALTGVLNSL